MWLASRFGAGRHRTEFRRFGETRPFRGFSGAAIGLLASTKTKNSPSRLFAIPFFNKGYWFALGLAVIVPAFSWSFLHSNYSAGTGRRFRGIEIGLVGIVAWASSCCAGEFWRR